MNEREKSDFEIAKQVISFYADKDNWKLYRVGDGNFTSKIAQDNGAIASAAISGFSKRNPEGYSIWLTEDLIKMKGYTLEPAYTGGYVIGKEIQSPGGTFMDFAGHDLVWTSFKDTAEECPFATKFLALLSLQKQLERKKI
jgi:hypothetical protein